jgi:hypothetical protein
MDGVLATMLRKIQSDDSDIEKFVVCVIPCLGSDIFLLAQEFGGLQTIHSSTISFINIFHPFSQFTVSISDFWKSPFVHSEK